MVGFMGCGKSSVGRRIAGLTGHRFMDSDEMVTQAAGRSIPEIFESEGEEGFRDIEERMLADTVGVCGIVLATGGGAIVRETNRLNLRRIGVVGWLDGDPELLFERATRSGRRPLLQVSDPRTTFFALLEERSSHYRETADFRVDSTGLGHDEVAQRFFDEAMRRPRRFEC